MLKTLRRLIHDLEELKHMMIDQVNRAAAAVGALEAEVASMQAFIAGLKSQLPDPALEAQLADLNTRLEAANAALAAARA